jgi:hypothetical protein
VIAVVLSAVGSAIWFVGGLILDKHVQSAVTAANVPMQTDIHRVDGDVQQVKAVVNVLQAQIAAQKFAVIPVKDLKNHPDELNNIKGNLATLPVDTPGYWPVSFQIISLASGATSETSENIPKAESSFDNVVVSTGIINPAENQRVVLKNLVQGLTFINSIVRFDPSVRLVNDTFINCQFIFPIQEAPPKIFQEIGKTLLASDLAKVTINAS